MNCPKCGKPMISGAQFCGYCGEKIILPWQGTQQISTKVHRPKRKILFSLGIIALCIIVCADVLLIRKVRTNYADEGRTTVSQEITTSFDTAASNDISGFEKIGSAIKTFFSSFEKDKSSAGKSGLGLKGVSLPKPKTPSTPYGGTMMPFPMPPENAIDPGYAPIFANNPIYRFQILSITFHDTTEIIPRNAWNVAYDGKIYAWVTEADISEVPDFVKTNILLALEESRTKEVYDLHIASDGIIFAPEDSSYLFACYEFLQCINFNGVFNTSNAKNMSHMFDDCEELVNLDVSGFDTSNVIDMSSMFNACTSLKSIDVSGFDTSSVTNMCAMFNYCPALAELDVSNFDTSNVTDMSCMVRFCSALTELDLSALDTSNVSDMCAMFEGDRSLATLDVSSFDTSNVEDMGLLFSCCAAIPKLNLSGFNTSNVTNMREMFIGCEALMELDLSGWDTSNVTNMSSMFANCNSLEKLDLSSFDTFNAHSMSSMFKECNALTKLDVSNFNTSNVTNMHSMFNGCTSLTKLDLSGFNTSNTEYMIFIFKNCSSLIELNCSSFDTAKAETRDALAGCPVETQERWGYLFN